MECRRNWRDLEKQIKNQTEKAETAVFFCVVPNVEIRKEQTNYANGIIIISQIGKNGCQDFS